MFKHYRNFDIDTLKQKYLKSEITKLDTNKDFQTSFYDEEFIEDVFSIIKVNEKRIKIIHNYSTKFIFSDGTENCNSICEKNNDYLSVLDPNQKVCNSLLKEELDRILQVDSFAWEGYQANKVGTNSISQLIEFQVLTIKCYSLQDFSFKGEEPSLFVGNLTFELRNIFKKRKDIIKPVLDNTCVFECIVMFKRLLNGDGYYYKNNTKTTKKLVAKYDMNEVPLDKIDIIGVQEGLNIHVFLYRKIMQLSFILMDYLLAYLITLRQ